MVRTLRGSRRRNGRSGPTRLIGAVAVFGLALALAAGPAVAKKITGTNRSEKIIGTNKPDAAETVTAMLEDAAHGRVLRPVHPEAAAAEAFVRARQPRVVSYADWRRLDEAETAAGRPQGRPRVKLTRVEDMLAALGRSHA